MSWLSWENPVSIWWVTLSIASLINILFWFWTRQYLYSAQGLKKLIHLWHDRRNIIWFSAIYVFVCAFRSVLPRADVQRICLFDTWFSSVMVGRTVATLAELAFVTQWMIVLKFISQQTNSKFALITSQIIVPIIFIAECFSWYAVIRTHYIGNVVEESLWAVTYGIILVSLVTLLPKLKGALKLSVQLSIFGCFLYVCFMVLVDVPMYFSRYIEDLQMQKPLLGFWEGLHDLNTRWVVTYDIADWKTEIPWQTLYFTLAVLVSIALCFVPLDRERLNKYLKQ